MVKLARLYPQKGLGRLPRELGEGSSNRFSNLSRMRFGSAGGESANRDVEGA